MQERSRGIAEMTAAMVISGTIGWFVLIAERPVLEVVFWRCVIGAITLAGLCLALRLHRVPISGHQLLLAALGGMAIVLNWLLLFGSFAHASIAVATAVYNIQPFILFGLGVIFFGERVTVPKLGWMALAFLGVLAIVLAKPTATYTGSGHYVLGIAMAALAAAGWAVAAATTKRLKGVAPQMIALVHVTTGSLMLAPLVRWDNLATGYQAWSALITLGIMHTGVMYALMYAAVQRLPTDLQGALSFVYPVVAILIDVVALGTQLEPIQIGGIAAVVVAAAGVTLGVGTRKAEHPPHLRGAYPCDPLDHPAIERMSAHELADLPLRSIHAPTTDRST
jgi:drug/metabolite transporter (DMT)-like permease